MDSFLQSSSGRFMMAAHAVFLGSTAVYLLTGSMYTWGIGPPLGITLAFVSVGLGMKEYLKETMFAVTVMPCALWGFAYLTGELDWRATQWPAYAMAVAAVIAIYLAVAPPGARARAS